MGGMIPSSQGSCVYKRERVYKWTWSTQEALFPAFLLGTSSHTHREPCCGKSWAGESWVCGQRRRPKLSFAFVVARTRSVSINFHINWHSELKSKITVSTREWSLDVPGISTGILNLWATWAWAYQTAQRKSHFSWIKELPDAQPWPILRELTDSWWAGTRRETNETRWDPER